MKIFQIRSPETFFWTAQSTSDDPADKVFPHSSEHLKEFFKKSFSQKRSCGHEECTLDKPFRVSAKGNQIKFLKVVFT